MRLSVALEDGAAAAYITKLLNVFTHDTCSTFTEAEVSQHFGRKWTVHKLNKANNETDYQSKM